MLIKRPRKWVKNLALSTLDFCGFTGFLHMSLYTPSFLSFAGEPFVLTRRVYHISLSHLKLLYLLQFRSPALSHKKGGGCFCSFLQKQPPPVGYLVPIQSPVHFVYMLYVAFALQTLLVGCDWHYFRTCDNPVTSKLFKNIIQS